ncbi:MAG: VOC family protein [Verrucomicrobiota bacterium]
MNYSVEHIGLAARNTTALRDWYVRVLSANEIFCDEKKPPAYFLQLHDGTRLEIYYGTASRPETVDNRLAGWRHLALRVDSIETARDYLAARGVIFTEPVKPAGGGGRVLFFQDPEGNLLHLVERSVDPMLE